MTVKMTLSGAPTGSIFDKKLGSTGNKIEHSIAQTKNMLKTSYKDRFVSTASLAATAGATAIVAKSKTAQEFLTNGFKEIASSNIGKGISEIAESCKPYAKKALDSFKALPKPAKVVLGVGVAITGAVSQAIRNKGLYTNGKIYQQHVDKAKKMDEVLD